ncbi:MAG: peptidylprolyl isomerase [Burkholderiales bacterium]
MSVSVFRCRAGFALVLEMLGLLALLGAAPALAQPTRPRQVLAIDRIVAVVGSEVITRHELDERLRLLSQQLKQQGTPLPPQDVLERQVLERMIAERAQLQFARDTGLRVDDAQLEAALMRIAEQNKLSIGELRIVMEKQGVPFARFREDIRGEMVMARLREREVDNRVIVTDTEVDNLIASQKAASGTPDEYNLSHILVSVPEKASPEQIQTRRARADQALAQLRGGADFRQVAAAFSEAPDAVQGGSLGWRDTARMPSMFAEAVQKLKPGETSDVLRSPNGFHILRLNERRGASGPLMVTQTNARHILIKTNELVAEKDARAKLVKLKERLDNGGDFAQVARINSEDASASRGGDLGWLSPGDTVPDFEKAMDALKPGQISEPVRSPFGWHLIQVVQRRDQDMSGDQQKMRARMALRQAKSEEAYQEWIRQMLDSVFIERRLESAAR